MAITFVGSAIANADSVSLPSHQTGDLILVCAYRHDGAGIPTRPSRYTLAVSGGASNNSMIVCFKLATSSSETSGTWTSATQIAALVYRSDVSNVLGVGQAVTTASGSSTSISYPIINSWRAESAQDAWAIGFCGSRTDESADTAPTGMTNITSTVSTGELAAHHTAGTVGGWSARTVATSTVAYRTIMVEIHEYSFSFAGSGGGGSFPLIGGGGLVY